MSQHPHPCSWQSKKYGTRVLQSIPLSTYICTHDQSGEDRAGAWVELPGLNPTPCLPCDLGQVNLSEPQFLFLSNGSWVKGK